LFVFVLGHTDSVKIIMLFSTITNEARTPGALACIISGIRGHICVGINNF
jgi:hypothetical protein